MRRNIKDKLEDGLRQEKEIFQVSIRYCASYHSIAFENTDQKKQIIISDTLERPFR